MNRTPSDIEPFVQIALRLQTLVQQKQYDLIPSLFTCISYKSGGALSIRLADISDPFYRESMLILTTPDGSKMEDQDEIFWRNLIVEKSFMGAWQVFLMKKLWHCLPLYDHASYNRATFFYSNNQLKEFATRGKDDFDRPVENLDFHLYDATPSLQYIDDSFIIKVFVWNNWRGLFTETEPIHIDQSGNITFGESQLDTLFEHNCGILF